LAIWIQDVGFFALETSLRRVSNAHTTVMRNSKT
jgi:hypothetical protein